MARVSMYADDSALYTSATTVTEMTATQQRAAFSFRVGGKEQVSPTFTFTFKSFSTYF
jgi:hypothetical protein